MNKTVKKGAIYSVIVGFAIVGLLFWNNLAFSRSNVEKKVDKHVIYKVSSLSKTNENQHVENDDDLRAYSHGIDLLTKNKNERYLVWSSAHGSEAEDGSWNHDVFVSTLNLKKPKIQQVRTLIAAPEAQEPVSGGMTKDGRLLLTFEDGYNNENVVSQRYVVFDSNLNVMKKYPQTIKDGGHSGHGTSLDNQHVVFWSDDWVDGGGVNNLGSGKDVLVTTLSSDGKVIHELKITPPDETRDWWPILKASKKNVALVWQRYVEDETYAQTMMALYDPKSNKLIKKPFVLQPKTIYYTYDVSYIDGLDVFVVSGTDEKGKGFLYTVNSDGKVIVKKHNLPGFIREAKPAIKVDNGVATFVYPKAKNGFMVYAITKNTVNLEARIHDNYEWQYGGTVGFFADDHVVYFASLSKEGIVEKEIRIKYNRQY